MVLQCLLNMDHHLCACTQLTNHQKYLKLEYISILPSVFLIQQESHSQIMFIVIINNLGTRKFMTFTVRSILPFSCTTPSQPPFSIHICLAVPNRWQFSLVFVKFPTLFCHFDSPQFLLNFDSFLGTSREFAVQLSCFTVMISDGNISISHLIRLIA